MATACMCRRTEQFQISDYLRKKSPHLSAVLIRRTRKETLSMHSNSTDEATKRQSIKDRADTDTAVAGCLSIMLSLVGLFALYQVPTAYRNLPSHKPDFAGIVFLTVIPFAMAVACWSDRKSPCWYKARKIRKEEQLLDSQTEKQ